MAQSSKDYRKRREGVSLKINILGWLIESLGQWILFVIYLTAGGDDIYKSTMMVPCYVFLQFILVSYTHLLNESTTKQLILSAGWLIAMRAVLKCNQNDADVQTEENIEMDVRNGGEGRTNTCDALAQTTDEQESEMCLNRSKINIGWLPNYGTRTNTFPATIRRFPSPVSSLEEINNGTSAMRSVLLTVRDKNEADLNKELVGTSQDITLPNNSPSSSSQQLNVLGSPHMAYGALSIDNGTENNSINITKASLISSINMLGSISCRNTVNCNRNLDSENRTECVPLKTSHIAIKKQIFEWH